MARGNHLCGSLQQPGLPRLGGRRRHGDDGIERDHFFYLQPRASPAVIAVALLALDIALSRFTLARPHVLAWPLLAGWTVLLMTAEEGRPPKLRWTLLLVIWTNLHASFPLALPVAAAIGLDTSIKTRWKHLREWLVFGTASIVAASLNANGLAGILQPLKISSLSILPIIGEWKATTLENSKTFFVLFLCGLAALLRARIRFPAGRLSLLIVMLALAFAHIRHQSSFAILAACIIPTLWASRVSGEKVPRWTIAGALPLVIFRALMPLHPPLNSANPWPMIAAIPEQLRSEPVFNEYTFGGPLIRSGIKPYIDGRAEMYGDEFVQNYHQITDGDAGAFEATVEQYGIEWVMLPWDEKQLIGVLRKSGAWCRIYSDRLGLIAVKRASPNAGLCLAPTRAKVAAIGRGTGQVFGLGARRRRHRSN